MLTRFVRTQLAIFTIASIIGIAAMVLVYMQLPTLLGIGRINVTLELPRTGGLYQFSNVTYQGVQIGKVTDIHATRSGAQATLSLANSPRIPADLLASVLSGSSGGRGAVRRPTAAHRLRAVPPRRFGDRGKGHHGAAESRTDARPGQRAARHHSQRIS